VKIIDNLINKFHYILDGKKRRKIRLDTFLNIFFKNKKNKFIIQVGGNDGINSDPLRKYIKKKFNGKAVIFEPLDYYFLKLQKLYKKKKNIKILKIALADRIEKKKIFFIDPKVAKQMNGKGPGKGWAHGQGSFSKDVVLYWIKKNKFRGKQYLKNINKFIKSIQYKEIKTKKISFDLKKPKQKFNSNFLQKIIHNYDGVICGDDDFDSKVLDKASKLKVISKWGTGVDSIDKISANKKNIKVYNVKDAFTNEVAVYAIGIIILLTRKFYLSHKDILKGKWIKHRGNNLTEKKIGIIGFGRIGKKISKICESLDLKIFVNDIDKSKLNRAKTSKIKATSLKNIFSNCDIIVFAVNLNKSSYHLLNNKTKNFLKRKPYIVNISRGPVLCEKTIQNCLLHNKISGFGTDVFETEPVDKRNSILKLQNTFFSTHNAYNTKESVRRTNDLVFQNLLRGLNL